VRELGELLRGGRRRRPVAVFALGRVAHDAVLDALDVPRRRYVFAHGAAHLLAPRALLVDSFHPSRYNTNTGRLTAPMFDAALARLENHLDA
jgi:uracil-DNA glycosylase